MSITPALIGAIAGSRRRTVASSTMGVTTIGGSNTILNDGVRLFAAKATAPATGNVTSFSIYCSNSNAAAKIKVGLYSVSSGLPLDAISGSPTEFTLGVLSAGWATFSGLTIPVTSGSDYWLAYVVNTGSSFRHYYDSAASGTDRYIVSSYASAWSSSPSTSADSAKLSVYATIT